MNSLVAIAVLFVAGCATDKPKDDRTTEVRRMSVAQVGMGASTEFVACSGCPDRTRKVLAVQAPSVNAVPKGASQILDKSREAAVTKPKLYPVHFPFGKSELEETGRAELTEALAEIKGTGGHIAILGRTDPIGKLKFNERLALKRATTVKKQLIEGGVRASSITVGRHEPCCDGDKNAPVSVHREQRRADVEIILTTK